jgi:hypothetical protein
MGNWKTYGQLEDIWTANTLSHQNSRKWDST